MLEGFKKGWFGKLGKRAHQNEQPERPARQGLIAHKPRRAEGR